MVYPCHFPAEIGHIKCVCEICAQVLSALNICGDAGKDAFAGSAGGCIGMGAFDAQDSFDYSGALARTLEAGVPVTFYFGKTDTACNYVGGLTMAETISWAGRDAFAAMELQPLEIFGVEAGQQKSYDGLTFIQVKWCTFIHDHLYTMIADIYIYIYIYIYCFVKIMRFSYLILLYLF